jgi:hypothetical protein
VSFCTGVTIIGAVSIRSLLPKPMRLLRYLVGPADKTYRAKYAAMSPEMKEAARWRLMKLDWFYRTFPSPPSQRPKKPRG